MKGHGGNPRIFYSKVIDKFKQLSIIISDGDERTHEKAMTKESLEKQDTKSIIAAYNNYLYDSGYSDDEILLQDEFADSLKDDDPLWILDRAFYGDYESQAYAYGFDGNGNIKSYSTEQDVRDEILGDDDFVKVAEKYL